jgi:hypothetical protein
MKVSCPKCFTSVETDSNCPRCGYYVFAPTITHSVVIEIQYEVIKKGWFSVELRFYAVRLDGSGRRFESEVFTTKKLTTNEQEAKKDVKLYAAYNSVLMHLIEDRTLVPVESGQYWFNRRYCFYEWQDLEGKLHISHR